MRDSFIIIWSISIIMFSIGWFYYYRTFPYWKRKDFWEKFTWIGIIVLSSKMRNFPKKPRLWATIALYLISITPLFLIISLIILK